MIHSQVLDLDNVTVSYQKKIAIQSMSFSIEKGEFVVLLGAAGAGKTTILRTVAGLEQSDHGMVSIDGIDVSNFPTKDRNIAMIFDSLALYPNKTGFENIAHPLRVRKMSNEFIESKIDQIAGVLKIHNVLGRLPKTMSGGEKQRVALGRALVREPALFMLDEPLASLDARLRIELRYELKRLQKENDYTFLMATPDYLEALAVADRVIMIVDGEIRQVGPAQELYDNPVDIDVARFVGSPKINILKASYLSNSNEVMMAGQKYKIPVNARDILENEDIDFNIGFRPEHIHLSDNGGIDVRIDDVERLGHTSIVSLSNDEVSLHMSVPSSKSNYFEIGSIKKIQIELDRFLGFDLGTGRRLF